MNEEALKMVGPSFEETKADTKGAEVSPDTTPSLVVVTAYTPAIATVSVLTVTVTHKN